MSDRLGVNDVQRIAETGEVDLDPFLCSAEAAALAEEVLDLRDECADLRRRLDTLLYATPSVDGELLEDTAHRLLCEVRAGMGAR